MTFACSFNLRMLASASAIALATPLVAQSVAFPEPAEFAGAVRASSAGTAIYAGDEITFDGRGLVPGQEVTLQRGLSPLNEDGPIVADEEGQFSLSFTLPEDAAVGTHPIVVIADNPAAATVVDLKISPLLPVSGTERFNVEQAPLVRGLYQVAHSAATDALFVTAAVGRPPVTESTLMKVDPETLEIIAQVQPAAAPARADGRDSGVFAVYGVAVDDARGHVWVTNTRQDTVAVYEQDDLSLVHQFEPGAVTHARDVVVDEANSRVYASAAFTNEISVFDAETLEQLEPISIQSTLRGQDFSTMSLSLDPAAGKLYTVSMTSPEAAVIDLSSGEVEQVILLPGAKAGSGISHDVETGRIFAAAQGTDNLIIVDEASGEVVADVPVGAGALNVVFDPTSRLAYVSNRGAGTLTVVTPDGEIVANMESGTFANHVTAAGNGTIFAVNKSRGEDDPEGDRITRITPAE